ncbi:MAG TPA: three-Cys-motif partner protein TcmP [Candidatus Wujingus californicus]|uniref:three-Cys-motif partner protein TcmP n=1 Tax=Candidatus Wujingus californicus TaxID=3367618 RepID=UPI00402669FE
MGHTKDFFKIKKGWSLQKDKIFNDYLTPYIDKILTTHRPLVIIDCFAGKGRFDDGNVGSPVIIAEHIKSVLEGNSVNKNIHGIFIENKYVEELETNLRSYKNCEIWQGTFEENISRIRKLDSRSNLFLYVDPYGIKCLDFQQFELIKAENFPSLEMLLNFNSFGFLREGCRLLKLDYENLFKEDQSEDEYELDEANTVDRMNNIAHEEYWQSIIEDYKNNKIGMFKAEDLFIKKYMNQLKNLFTYVINIPISLKIGHIPKYRLIFGSNHPGGMILMADNMSRIWKELKNVQRGSQKVLFEYEFPDPSIQLGFDLKEGILNVLKEHKKSLLLQELLVELFENYGIAFSEKEYKDKLKEMERNQIIIDREPALTERGKKATALDYRNRKYKITVRLKC